MRLEDRIGGEVNTHASLSLSHTLTHSEDDLDRLPVRSSCPALCSPCTEIAVSNFTVPSLFLSKNKPSERWTWSVAVATSFINSQTSACSYLNVIIKKKKSSAARVIIIHNRMESFVTTSKSVQLFVRLSRWLSKECGFTTRFSVFP